jgi:DNA polymerase III subunit epsilon
MSETVIFLDFEASSLFQDSWPIEIGLARLDEDLEVSSEARLIYPHPEWPMTSWSPASQAVHGIPFEHLTGARPAAEVAAWALARLEGRVVLSDNPAWERKWLDRLLATIGRAGAVEVLPYFGWVEAKLDPARLDWLHERLARRTSRHRAGPDAARLAEAYASARLRQVAPSPSAPGSPIP